MTYKLCQCDHSCFLVLVVIFLHILSFVALSLDKLCLDVASLVRGPVFYGICTRVELELVFFGFVWLIDGFLVLARLHTIKWQEIEPFSVTGFPH